MCIIRLHAHVQYVYTGVYITHTRVYVIRISACVSVSSTACKIAAPCSTYYVYTHITHIHACTSASSTAWIPCKIAEPCRPSISTSSTGITRGKSTITTDVGEEGEEKEAAAAAAAAAAVETWQTRCMCQGRLCMWCARLTFFLPDLVIPTHLGRSPWGTK